MMKPTKPKSIKDFLLGILFMAILGLIAYGLAWLFQSDPEPGDIKVYSGDAEIVTQRFITAEEKKKSVTDFTRIDLSEDADALPEIIMDKSIMLEATQDPITDMYYSLYDENMEEVYYRQVSFTYPDSPGSYYIIIDTMWGTSDHKFMTQHGFELIIE